MSAPPKEIGVGVVGFGTVGGDYGTAASSIFAFQNQVDGKGYSLVEVLATCPTNWHMSPLQSNQHVVNTVTKVFPLS